MTRKVILLVAVVAVLGVMAAACAQSPMIVYIVVTATPTGTGGDTVAPTATPTTEQPNVDATATTAPPATETVPTATPGQDIIVRQIYVAEQQFQRGRMFWIEPTGQIWVMVETEPGVGIWEVYEDLFREGDPESDPSVVPPAGLLQPIRGFGLIWRTGENVRDNLGWATDIEVGFVSNYEYHPGEGSTPGNPVRGFHFMQNQYGDWYRFNEINGTWQTVNHTSALPTATPEATQ